MKFALSVLLVCLVTACAAGSPMLPQNIQPIVGEITMGVRPVEQGQQIDATKISRSEGGQAQSVTISTQSLVDVSRTADEFTIRLEVINAEVDSQNVPPSEVDDIRGQFAQLIGAEFTYRMDTRTGEGNTKIRSTALDVDMLQEREAGLTRSIREGYMGGLTVRQNQEVARADLSQLFPAMDLGDASGSISSRVVGQTIYAGRSVVAVSTDGTVNVGGASAKVRGVSLVDIATGVPLHSDFLLTGLRIGGGIQDIAMSQRLTIYGG